MERLTMERLIIEVERCVEMEDKVRVLQESLHLQISGSDSGSGSKLLESSQQLLQQAIVESQKRGKQLKEMIEQRAAIERMCTATPE